MGMYIEIENLDPTKVGAVSQDKIGDLTKLIRVDSASISRSNPLYMQVGNMADIKGNNLSFSELHISRRGDGVSALLATWFYKQIQEPRKVTLLITKGGGGNVGDIPVYKAELEGCFLTNQSISSSFEGDMQESFSITYQTLSETYYAKDDKGTVKAGAAVKYDLKENKLVSEAK